MAEKCSSCGAELTGSEKFCGACGASVAVAQSKPQSTSDQPAINAQSAAANQPSPHASGLSAGSEKPLEDRLATIVIAGLIFACAIFAANTICVAFAEEIAKIMVSTIASGADFNTLTFIFGAASWMAMIPLTAILAAAGSFLVARIQPRPVPTLSAAAGAGLLAAIITIILMTRFVDPHHYTGLRFERQFLPLALISLTTGFAFGALVYVIGGTRTRQ